MMMGSQAGVGTMTSNQGGAMGGLMAGSQTGNASAMAGSGMTGGMSSTMGSLRSMMSGAVATSSALPQSMIDVMQNVLSDAGAGSSSGIMQGMLDAMDDLMGSTSLTASGQSMVQTMQDIVAGSGTSVGTMVHSLASAMHNAGFSPSMSIAMVHGLSANSAQAFEFTITNGQVTGMEAVLGNYSHAVPMPANATFTIGADTVTETITGSTSSEVIQYGAEAGNSSLYQVSQDIVTLTDPTTSGSNGNSFGTMFTIANGAVTGESQVMGNATHTSSFAVSMPPDAIFSVGTASVTEMVAQGNTVETITFVQPPGSTLYAVASVSTAIIPTGSASTLLSINPFDRAEFTISNGTITQIETVAANGAATTVSPGSHTAFTPLAPGFIEEATTSNGHSSYEVFYAGSGSNGIYTEIAHGTGTTVDLVGLQAQLAQLPAAVAALV